MKRFLVFILVLVISGIPAYAQKAAKGGKGSGTSAAAPKYGNTDGITADQLRKYLTFIASDELEGPRHAVARARHRSNVYCRAPPKLGHQTRGR